MIVHAIFSGSSDAQVLGRLAGPGREVRPHPVSLRATTGAVLGLVADLTSSSPSAPGTPRVLHALDPGAWVVATAARRLLDLPLVLRVGDGLDQTSVLLPCLLRADAVTVTSLGARADLVRRGVRAERVEFVPEVPDPFTGRALDPLLCRRIVVLADGRRPGAELGALRGVGSSLSRTAPVTVSPHGTPARDRAGLIDAADVVVCGAAGDREAVQAMWRGRAVVAPDSDVMDEVVVDRHTGRLFRAGDGDDLLVALARIIGSPFAVEAHGLAGRRRAEARFGAPAGQAALDRLYARIERVPDGARVPAGATR